jgi:predicted ATP-grasp superfamily ATP-dependent carboligase
VAVTVDVRPGLSRWPPFLLTVPAYGGTLAAARCLGLRGIPVTMAGDGALVPARWSRHVTRWVRSPPVGDIERFLDWLLAFGEREPGHVLYPTCDDLAWLIADRAEELGKVYRLYQPGVGAILRLLDKKALHEACAEVGVDTVPTAFPVGVERALSAARELGFPVLLKPRTQILSVTRTKGSFVERPDALAGSYAGFLARNLHGAALSSVLPAADLPMVQVFRPQANDGIYSIAGFVGSGAGEVAARASRKILQRPRRLGVGVCYEEAPVDAAALDGVVRLCRAVGYFGVFEAEYVPERGRLELIDFNPRFYGQMGFEIARDMPLAYLAWLGALGEEDALARTLSEVRGWPEGRGYAYCYGFVLGLTLLAQRVSGRMTAPEVRRWRQWRKDHQRCARMVDAADWPGDRVPGLAAAAAEIHFALRHPRAFMRNVALGVN